jgi:hypothetical protein
VIYLLLLEVGIVLGSWFDARMRTAETDSALRRSWGLRWFWWHLAPLWFVWLSLAVLLRRATHAVARGAVRRYRDAQTVTLLVDRSV